MARNNPYGTIQKAVSEAYTAAGGLEAAAADIGLSTAHLSRGTEVPQSGQRVGGMGINDMDTLCRINPASAAVLARHFAALAGGVYEPVQIEKKAKPLHEVVGFLAKETGEAMAATISAMASGSVEDLTAAVREMDDEVKVLLQVLAQMKDMIKAKEKRAN